MPGVLHRELAMSFGSFVSLIFDAACDRRRVYLHLPYQRVCLLARDRGHMRDITYRLGWKNGWWTSVGIGIGFLYGSAPAADETQWMLYLMLACLVGMPPCFGILYDECGRRAGDENYQGTQLGVGLRSQSVRQ